MDNIGEVLFLAKCMELDLIASRPYAPCKYDFIVDNSETLFRVQVKMIGSTRPTKKGDVYVGKIGSGNKSKSTYTKKEIDVLAILCYPINVWYIIPIEQAGDIVSMYFYPHRTMLGDLGSGKHEKFFNKWIYLLNRPSRKHKTKEVKSSKKQNIQS
jgi:hypothetical protein